MPLRVVAAPCKGAPGDIAQSECARALYASGRFAEAAEVFTGLWEHTGSAKFLYNMALAREAAGSGAWALALLSQYLDTPGLSAADREDALSRSERILSRLGTVDVAVVPAAALGEDAVVSFEREHAGRSEVFSVPLRQVAHPGGLRLHLDLGLWIVWIDPRSAVKAYNLGGKAHVTSLHVTDTPGTARLELKPATAMQRFRVGPPGEVRRGVQLALRDPDGIEPEQFHRIDGSELSLPLRTGNWTYRARPRGLVGELQTGTIEVGRGEVVQLDWKPSKTVLAERAFRRNLLVGLAGAAGGALLIGGGILARLGVVSPLPCIDEIGSRCDAGDLKHRNKVDDVREHWRLGTVGGGFVGAGLGLGLVTGLAALPPRRARLVASLVGGGLITAAGVIAHASVRHSYLENLREVDMVFGEHMTLVDAVEAGTLDGTINAGAWTALLLGAGVGLTAGSGSAALLRHFAGPRAKARVAGSLGPRMLGLSVSGRF